MVQKEVVDEIDAEKEGVDEKGQFDVVNLPYLL